MEDMTVGNVVSGIVSGVKSYGIFVKFENGYNGLIHISKITDKFVKNIEDYAKVGETIFCEIERVDHENKQCVLTIKDLNYRVEENPLIHETIKGFSTLRKHLPEWIEEKKKEYKIQ